MNIADLIKKLEKVREQHGDIRVRWGDYSEGMADEVVLSLETSKKGTKMLFLQEYNPGAEL
jgi:hypothetical protein